MFSKAIINKEKYSRYKRICHQQWSHLSFSLFRLAARSGWPLPLSYILTREPKKTSQYNMEEERT